MALPNVSKFFLRQALEERKAAEALMKYQQERGGHYCSRTIQVGSRQQPFKQLQSTVITLTSCIIFLVLQITEFITIRFPNIISLSYQCMWFCSWLYLSRNCQSPSSKWLLSSPPKIWTMVPFFFHSTGGSCLLCLVMDYETLLKMCWNSLLVSTVKLNRSLEAIST